MLATAADDRARDGPRALEYATRACELSGWSDAAILDTMGAACAEAGRFPEAIWWEEKVLALAKPNDSKFIEDATARLALYRENKPYRDFQPAPTDPR